MARTDTLRKQHETIAKTVGEIVPLLQTDLVKQNASRLKTLLAELSGRLTVHLAMEDKVLYPELLKSPNPKVKSLAQRYMDEMGSLSKAFMDYVGAWPSIDSIASEPAKFVTQTKQVFGALDNRIKRENTELYPMLDNVS